MSKSVKYFFNIITQVTNTQKGEVGRDHAVGSLRPHLDIDVAGQGHAASRTRSFVKGTT